MDENDERPHPAEHSIENISAASRAILEAVRGKGRRLTEAHRKSIARAMRGRSPSAETRKKIGDAVRAAHDLPVKRQFTREHLKNLRAAAKKRSRGRHSWEARLKMKRAAQGRRHSEETKEKIRQARLGTGSPKEKREVANKKLSETMKTVWAIRKARAAGEVPAWLHDELLSGKSS